MFSRAFQHSEQKLKAAAEDPATAFLFLEPDNFITKGKRGSEFTRIGKYRLLLCCLPCDNYALIDLN